MCSLLRHPRVDFISHKIMRNNAVKPGGERNLINRVDGIKEVFVCEFCDNENLVYQERISSCMVED